MIGPDNETNMGFHITPECWQLCSLAHHVTGCDLVQFFCSRQHRVDELGLIGGCDETPPQKTTKKKQEKKPQSPSKELL